MSYQYLNHFSNYIGVNVRQFSYKSSKNFIQTENDIHGHFKSLSLSITMVNLYKWRSDFLIKIVDVLHVIYLNGVGH